MQRFSVIGAVFHHRVEHSDLFSGGGNDGGFGGLIGPDPSTPPSCPPVPHGLYLGGVFYAAHLGTPAGIAAIIVGMQPILTAVINRILFGQSVTSRQTLGLFLGFIGLIAVIAGSTEISGSKLGLLGLTACLVVVLGVALVVRD